MPSTDAEVRELHDDGCCARCTGYADYVRSCADLMGLRDWEFQIEHGEPATPDAHAEIQMAPGRRIGRLRVSSAVDGLEPEERRHVIAHELAHPLVRDLIETVREGVRGEFGGAAFRVFIGAVEREHERLVDHLATVISPVLPFP